MPTFAFVTPNRGRVWQLHLTDTPISKMEKYRRKWGATEKKNASNFNFGCYCVNGIIWSPFRLNSGNVVSAVPNQLLCDDVNRDERCDVQLSPKSNEY